MEEEVRAASPLRQEVSDVEEEKMTKQVRAATEKVLR
jgi:hypothetical protein